MKNYLRYISLSMVFAGFLFTSCEEEDAPFEVPTYIGGYAYLADQSISSFDKNENLKIDFFTDSGVTVNSVEIIQDEATLATATVGDGNATFNSSVFGDFAIDDAFNIMIKTELSNGNTAKDPFTVDIVSPISIEDENPTELSLDSLANGATVDYSIYTLSASIDVAELFIKKNSEGAYMNSAAEVSTEGGTIELADTNYENLNLAVNDTLYYEFRLESGDLNAKESSFIRIIEDEE
jgi:hypothetical protein